MVDLKIELPKGFLDEEIRCGYTVTRKMKEVWAVELDLLAEFDRVCKKYNLRYFADGGTMLGAVRHQGFIPWDDDIDIVMMRDNYQKLCEIANREVQFPYFFQTDYSDPGSNRGHAQFRNTNTTGILLTEEGKKYKFNQGIFIDIFPLDYVPNDLYSRNKYINKINKLNIKWHNYYRFTLRYCESKNRCKNVIKNIIRTSFINMHIRCGVHGNLKFKQFEQVVVAQDRIKTNYVAKLFFYPVKNNYIWKSSWFMNTKYMQFEMLAIPVSINYKEILTKFYGDWETPIKQDSTHGGVIFDTDKSYIEYLEE